MSSVLIPLIIASLPLIYLGYRWVRAYRHYRNATLICMRQENTYIWGPELGPMTPGRCCECQSPIYFERQNGFIKRKICHVCAYDPRTARK